jgi:hypothetical protein
VNLNKLKDLKTKNSSFENTSTRLFESWTSIAKISVKFPSSAAREQIISRCSK